MSQLNLTQKLNTAPVERNAKSSAEPLRRVIMVAHGSRSPEWVDLMSDWSAGVRRFVAERAPGLTIEQTFLEITAPTFAERLAELRDAAADSGTNVLAGTAVFPFFLARGGHVGEDIPEALEEILGAPNAMPEIQPSGWIEALADNADRRLAAFGARPGDSVIVCGYGARLHGDLWVTMTADIQAATRFADDAPWGWAACGHFMDDYAEPLRTAIRSARDRGARRVAVLPLFLGVSSYQRSLIPSTLAEFGEKVIEFLFQPDAILPDATIERWAAEQILAAKRD